MGVDFEGIRKRRIRKGLSLTEAANRAGWTPQKWANFEAGRRNDPRISTLEEVAAVLGCRVDQLLRRKS